MLASFGSFQKPYPYRQTASQLRGVLGGRGGRASMATINGFCRGRGAGGGGGGKPNSTTTFTLLLTALIQAKQDQSGSIKPSVASGASLCSVWGLRSKVAIPSQRAMALSVRGRLWLSHAPPPSFPPCTAATVPWPPYSFPSARPRGTQKQKRR